MIELFVFCALVAVVAIARSGIRPGAASATAREASGAVDAALRRVRHLLDATEAELGRAARAYRDRVPGTVAAGSAEPKRVPYPRLPVGSAAEVLLLDRAYRRLNAEERLRPVERELAEAALALTTDVLSYGATGELVRRAEMACLSEETWAATVVPPTTVSAHFERNAASYAALLEPYLGAPEVVPVAPVLPVIPAVSLAAPASAPEPAPVREPEETPKAPAVAAPELSEPARPEPASPVPAETPRPAAAEPCPRREPAPTPAPAPTAAVTAQEIARRAEAFPIRLDLFRPEKRLRGYQLFGAKFILEAGRSILGDEMGLGKTVEALAAMAHLAKVEKEARFLVVCPAGAVQNWVSEVGVFTTLRAHVLGGPERDRSFLSWKRDGGVLIASYNGLRDYDISGVLPPISLLVADEAHLIKNPNARRTMVVERIVRQSPRACFMTGTPLENRIAEFRRLAGMLRPDVAERLPLSRAGGLLVTPESFRERTAEIYLRRNQEDVLFELPERIEMEEWVDLGETERDRYRRALLQRNLMAARQAVTVSDGAATSAKLRRLLEILDVYRESGEKVLVFSFFHSVLAEIGRRVPVVGRIDGSVPSAGRQRLIDDLRAAPGHAVLLAQVEAGGLALNIQAASVVVLMEPQWKPSTESQAIARVHRMGQPRRVMVHRLLARRTIDERLVALLRAKQGTFDDHVRDSSVKRASLDAVDTAVATAAFEEEYVREVREADERRDGSLTLAA